MLSMSRIDYNDTFKINLKHSTNSSKRYNRNKSRMNSRLKIQLREKPNDENIYGMLNDSYKINTQILIFSSRSITIKCFKQAA